MMRKLIVLDLDETLIYSSEGAPLERPSDFSFGQFHTYIRPGLESFLKFAFRNFDVAVWTSATRSYGLEIVNELFGDDYNLEFFWTRSRCTLVYDEELQENVTVKRISKIKRQGFDLDNIVVVDDRPEQWKDSYGNLIRVDKFFGDPEDDELGLLTTYLRSILGASSIRSIDKRGWRKSIKR